jgi:drug/metabolite transporter (DMT)-like permease
MQATKQGDRSQESGVRIRLSVLHLKTVVLTLVVIFASVAGNFSLTWGMRRTGPGVFESPLGYITALFDPWVALGVCLLLVWMLSQMALLSWADLSYVLPVTSAGYVLAAIAGRLFLQERISTGRWTGIALIMSGVVLVGRTAHSSTGEPGR